jgi:hypothetical protein
VVLEAFLDGTEPDPVDCGDRPSNLPDLPWPFQLAFYSPRPGEPMPTPEAVAIANWRMLPERDRGEAPPPDVSNVIQAAFGSGTNPRGGRRQPTSTGADLSSIR